MHDNNQDLLLRVIERYLYHSNYKTSNPEAAAFASKLCDIELWELWALTQN